MSAVGKLNREQKDEEMPNKQEVRDEVAALFLRGMERIAEVQKQYIDIAVQHNTDLVEIVKKTADKLPAKPYLPMLDLTKSAMNRFADIEKAAIDFTIEQTRVWTDVFKDRTSTIKDTTESTTDVAKQALERSFAVQKTAMEHTAAQAKEWVEATRRDFGMTGTQADALTGTFQRGVEAVVGAQKEILDLVTH